jgi:glycerol-3-phosphate cytidylyltransferase-like family protein
MNNIERNEVISNHRCVDLTILGCPCPITEEFIKKYKIDIVVHANDMSHEELNKWYAVPIKMGIFNTVEYEANISTTEIINRIKDRQ